MKGAIRALLFVVCLELCAPAQSPTVQAWAGSRAGSARSGDARGGDARGGDARGGDARSGDARSGDARGWHARGGDAGGDARGGDARGAETGGDAWQEPVEGVTWTKPEAVIDGELNEYPDLAIDGRGAVWMAWVGYTSGRERILVRRLSRNARAWSDNVISLGAGVGPTGWPRVAAYGRYVWVTWAERRGPRFEIRLASFYKERLERVETVSVSAFDAIRPAIVLDRSQTPWIAWEEGRGGRFVVMIRRMSRLFRSAPRVVDDSGELNQRAALAPGPGKTVRIAWDHYQDSAYNIRFRVVHPDHMERPVWVTRDRYLDQAPALYTDRRDRTWIAWHSDRPDEGETPRGGRTLRLVRYDRGRLYLPAAGPPPTLPALPGRPDLDETLEFPTLAADRTGRLFLFARRGQGFVTLYLSNEGWSRPIDLSEPGWGGRGRELRVALDDRGVFHLAGRWLHKVGYSLLRPPAGNGGPLPVGDVWSPPPPQLALEGEGPAASQPADAQGGTPDRPYFGDLHTHSWMSDGADDPDLIFTRARDLLHHDFVALTDHDVSNGNRLAPFEWAYIRMLTGFFDRPGRFVTLPAYEWTSPSVVKGGFGHRNVYFPTDQNRIFHVDDGAPDTLSLFDLIRSTGAFTIPHHTSWTGTDWEHFDPVLQPLFEVVSLHGNSEKADGTPIVPRQGEGGSYAVEGFKRGLEFGFVGGSDGHGYPWHYGVSRQEDGWTTGLTGIRAGALERSALIDALKHRRCYATSGAKVLMRVTVNGEEMGGEVRVNAGVAELSARVAVTGTAPLASIAWVDAGEGVTAWTPDPGETRFEASFSFPLQEQTGVYYLRVVQQDQVMAWSSPIRVERTEEPLP